MSGGNGAPGAGADGGVEPDGIPGSSVHANAIKVGSSIMGVHRRAVRQEVEPLFEQFLEETSTAAMKGRRQGGARQGKRPS